MVITIWLDIFFLVKVFYFDRDKSDYVFIKIIKYSRHRKKWKRVFKFENFWLTDLTCEKVVEEVWIS